MTDAAVILLGLVFQAPPNAPPGPPTHLLDPRLDAFREASERWALRPGPKRKVVDQVCLVPDLPTFLAVVSTWDRETWFPILWDDAETSLRFLRAFRPARVVRYPKRVPPPDDVWTSGVEAVGQVWSKRGSAPGPCGDRPPPGDAIELGAPGVVLSSPEVPAFAAAVALAAGRFQPLVRWEPQPKRGFRDVMTIEEAAALADDAERTVAAVVPRYARLGDDVDFLTLALDLPYAYAAAGGKNAIDDRIGRGPGSDLKRRWAFTGRLVGDEPHTVYQAMCSLFLTPRLAMLFNTYDEAGMPWSNYVMTHAAGRLTKVIPTSQVARPGADLAGWHAAFDPANRYGLVMVNSSGGPGDFNIPGGHGGAADVPRGGPTAVVMIHSFSAADPLDPSTIAGRWLAQGAFAYFGSMHEPFLQSFRLPTLVADLLARGVPFGAAVRQEAPETPFGAPWSSGPWRLEYLGDPLFRLERTPPRPDDRLPPPNDDWPSYRALPQPSDETPGGRLAWAVRSTIAGTVRDAKPGTSPLPLLRELRREAMPPAEAGVRDALLIDALFEADRPDEVISIFADDPSSDARRAVETARAIVKYRRPAVP